MAKKFKVATSGKTVDGRTIDPKWISQMAASYSTDLYGARINCEHIIGLNPKGDFPAFGDVVGLSTEEQNGEMVLFAEIEPTNELVEMVNNRKKVYTSVEINPDFRGTGEAYLMGLAVTDNPASVGTEMLSFARDRGVQSAFTQTFETDMAFDDKTDAAKNGITEYVKNLFSKQGNGNKAHFADYDSAIKLLAHESDKIVQENTQMKIGLAKSDTQIAELHKKLDELEARLSQLDGLLGQKDLSHSDRPSSTGQEFASTDC